MKSKILFLICLSFILGVFIRSYFYVNLYFNILFIFLGVIIFFYFISNKKREVFLNVSLILIFISFGIWRMNLADRDIKEMDLYKNVGQSVQISGIISNLPQVKGDTKKFFVDVEHLQKNERILVSTKDIESYFYGDEVSFRSKIEIPESFQNDLGKTFDYASYLKKDNVYFISYPEEVSVISRNNGNVVLSNLYKFRSVVLRNITKSIQAPESSLGAGIVLGVKEGLGQKTEDEFIKTGTIHIVALSGYNVTIVAEWLIRILSIFLSITVSLWVGIVGIVVFVVMTGAGSTVVRAGVMAILVLVGRILGREYDIGRGLVIAGTLMILINPWILVYDVSFQLSFMATIGLVYLASIIKRKIKFIPEKFNLRSLVGDTLGTYIFVLPFIVYVMGNLSLVAIFANVMIVPFVPLTMLLVFITATLSFVFSYLGIFFGFISWALLHYELYMVHFFASLPFSSVNISHVSILIVIFIYVVLGFFMYKENRGSQPEKI